MHTVLTSYCVFAILSLSLAPFRCVMKINEDWLMLKGCVIGCKKRCITLRKSLMSHSRRIHLEVRSSRTSFSHRV